MEEKTKRVRSPNFPILNLEKSLEIAAKIFNAHKKYSVSLESVGGTIGVAFGSYLAQHVSALSQYGLIDTQGEGSGRKIQLSEIAFKIIIDERPTSIERDGLIKQAALSPGIFRKLHETYPNELPSDSHLEYDLKANHGFNPNAVNSFMSVFKKTMEFAKVYEGDIEALDNNIYNGASKMGNINSQPAQEQKKPSQESIVGRAEIDLPPLTSMLPEQFPITLKDNKKAILSFSSLPIRRDDIELIKKYLDLMADNWSVASREVDEKEN